MAKLRPATDRFGTGCRFLDKVNRSIYLLNHVIVSFRSVRGRVIHQQQHTMHSVTHCRLHASEAHLPLGTSCRRRVWRMMNVWLKTDIRRSSLENFLLNLRWCPRRFVVVALFRVGTRALSNFTPGSDLRDPHALVRCCIKASLIPRNRAVSGGFRRWQVLIVALQ